MSEFQVLRLGATGGAVRRLQAATNRRLRARQLAAYVVSEDGWLAPLTLQAARKAAWGLGAHPSTLEAMIRNREVPIGVQRMILNPGRRSQQQVARGKARIADLRRRRAGRAHRTLSDARRRVVANAKRAAANYRARPGVYHYLAGGKPNLVYLEPTARDWRSDCSQFVASVYADAGLPSPGDTPHLWVNTWAIDRRGTVTKHPRPGDLGLYGAPGNPRHVELYIGEDDCMFIGHGTQPIDSRTPGLPNYYVTYDFLD